MRKADRLFQIVQTLRRKSLVTAAQLAEELEVSERTIYRDMDSLLTSGVPIEGEAGVGYRMGQGFEMPPLMFSPEEVEALTLGMRMVQQWGDPDLRRSAKHVLEKVEDVLPRQEKERLASAKLFALSFAPTQEVRKVQRVCRMATNERRKLTFDYEDEKARSTRRTVCPLGLYFWGQSWTLAAWCEMRKDYRSFRLDRMREVKIHKEPFELTPPITLDDFMRAARRAARRSHDNQ